MYYNIFMARKKRRVKIGRLIFVVFLLMAITIGIIILVNLIKESLKTEELYFASQYPVVVAFDDENNEREFTRGSKVTCKLKPVEKEEVEYRCFKVDDKKYYILDEYLEDDRNNCVKEKELYTLRNSVVTKDVNGYEIVDYVKKNVLVNITGFNNLKEDGTVDYYEINNKGYLKANKLDHEYKDESYDRSIYADAYFSSGGNPTLLDYYPKEKLEFKNNKMPEVVKALYINAEAISNIGAYLDLAQGSNINAFVVDIKDCYVDTQIAYENDVTKKYAPSTDNIPNSFDTYQESIKRIKDTGYYVIGRITAFKDDAFAKDNPEESLLYEDGTYYHYNFVDWPSIYSRKMWEYNVALALEAVEDMGFNEIQFDYVRSPEYIDDGVLRRNIYDETPSECILEFLRYASEQLHKHEAYISADVFGEISGWTTNSCTAFVSSYGQFWPAISNCVDAISSMPYPDHFSNYAYDIESPWANPGEIMYAWGQATNYAQDKTYDKAKCRTWIQAQSSDVYDIEYGADKIKAQLDALKKADVYDGFLTWNAASSYYRYEMYINVLD